MKLNRRQFVRQTAQTAAVLSVARGVGIPTALAEDNRSQGVSPESIPAIIDTHQHLWDLSKLRLSWLKGDSQLNRSYLIKDYLEATAGLSVVKAVYMEVAVDRDCQAAEAELIEELCRRGGTPTVAAVIGGCPGEEDFRAYITRFKDSPYIKGVRQIPRAPMAKPSLYLEAPFVQGIRLLGELGMSFDLCMAPDRLPDAAKLVDQCSTTRFIVDHCGNADPKWFAAPRPQEPADNLASRRRAADQWRRDMAALAQRKNVVCKISGIVARMTKGAWTAADLAPVVNHCLEVFGPERVMFASDWPVCTRAASLRQWVTALLEIVRDRTPDQQRKLWHDNALRVYGLRT